MKKRLAFIMAGLLCVASLVSCKSSNPSEGNKKEETPEVVEDTRDHSKMIIAISESQKEFYSMAIAPPLFNRKVCAVSSGDGN